MFNKFIIPLFGLFLFIASSCTQHSPIAPSTQSNPDLSADTENTTEDSVQNDDANQNSDTTQNDKNGSPPCENNNQGIAYIKKNTSTNCWEFYQQKLSGNGKQKLLFTLPDTQTGEILALEYHSEKGFLFIQKVNSSQSHVFTIALDGSDLQEYYIHAGAFKKEHPRWNNNASLFVVASNYGGQHSALNLYSGQLSDPPPITFAGSSAVFTGNNKIIYYVYGTAFHGGPKIPDTVMIANVDGSDAQQLLETTAWPRDINENDQLLYIDGSLSGTYNIKRLTINSSSAPEVVKSNIPGINRAAHVRYAKHRNLIIYETVSGIYQMKKNGNRTKKIADGLFPVILK